MLKNNHPNVLIIGYGNPDRQDDGVAWHILSQLAVRLGRPVPAKPEDGEFYPEGPDPHFFFMLQLTPETAETISGYDRVCFVDAHTGSVPEDVNLTVVKPIFQSSPFTHHLTPQSCLSFADSVYHRMPGQVILISVRGFKFGFSRIMSPQTTMLADRAVQVIWDWLSEKT